MAEVIVKKMDPKGRINIPIEWRNKWRSNKVVLRRTGNRIDITPLEPINPSDLFDSIKISGDVDLSDSHFLKKGVLEP